MVKKAHIPRRTKKCNTRKHRKQVWMTNDLLAKVVKKELYVKWKTTLLTSVNYEINKEFQRSRKRCCKRYYKCKEALL